MKSIFIIAILFATACSHGGNAIDLHPDSSAQTQTTDSYHPVTVGGPSGQAPPPSPTPILPTPHDGPKQDEPVASPTPQPTPQAITATFYFDFGSTTLRTTEQAKLDDLLKNLARYSDITSIRIVGMSDPVGNPVNNAKVAQSRAEAVRDALVSRSAELFAKPLNKDLIVVSFSTPDDSRCSDETSRADKINCLQSDRRADVVIEVMGAANVSQP